MSARLKLARVVSGPEEWNRRRLQVALAVSALVVTAVVAGIVWSIVELMHVDATGRADDPDPNADYSGVTVFELAPIEEAQPGPLSSASNGTLLIPQPASLGEAQVGTDFPRSAQGALAQLIAIDRRAIESGSVVTAQDVITAWSAPGGPTAQTWSGVAAVQTLLESAALPASGSTDLVIQLEPAMGLIQDETPTVCVDFVLSVSVLGGAANRIAVADCQRMAWLGDRWVIGPGAEAVPTPSLWPGSQGSYDAGYQWLEVDP